MQMTSLCILLNQFFHKLHFKEMQKKCNRVLTSMFVFIASSHMFPECYWSLSFLIALLFFFKCFIFFLSVTRRKGLLFISLLRCGTHEQKKPPKHANLHPKKGLYARKKQVIWQIFSSFCTGPKAGRTFFSFNEKMYY